MVQFETLLKKSILELSLFALNDGTIKNELSLATSKNKNNSYLENHLSRIGMYRKLEL